MLDSKHNSNYEICGNCDAYRTKAPKLKPSSSSTFHPLFCHANHDLSSTYYDVRARDASFAFNYLLVKAGGSRHFTMNHFGFEM